MTIIVVLGVLEGHQSTSLCLQSLIWIGLPAQQSVQCKYSTHALLLLACRVLPPPDPEKLMENFRTNCFASRGLHCTHVAHHDYECSTCQRSCSVAGNGGFCGSESMIVIIEVHDKYCSRCCRHHCCCGPCQKSPHHPVLGHRRPKPTRSRMMTYCLSKK